MNNQHLGDDTSKMIKRYSDRYQQLGYDVKTLGWGSKAQQLARFQQTTSIYKFSNSDTILDIGCGFGDYFQFLMEEQIVFRHYTGCDINEDLLNEARKRNNLESSSTYTTANIKNSNAFESSSFDVGVMLGVLNLNFHGAPDNYEYSMNAIKNVWKWVDKVLIIDFLSNRLSPSYPKEDFVFYHDPVQMLEFAFSLSSNVILKHDYLPIPQKEFMIFIFK